MVDSRKSSAMGDRIDDLTKRVETVGTKLDRLSASVDQRFEHVDRRVEHVDKRFNAVDERFNAVDERFNAVDERFNAIDERFNAVDERFNAVDAALLEQRQYIEFAYSRLETKMDLGFSRVDRIERKLDQFIDVQLQTNQLVDRRLRALEEQRGPGPVQ
jgi:chromosome segregation ATPase